MKTVYRIHATMSGNQTLTGRLINEPSPAAVPYAIHPWVSDQIEALMPSIAVRTSGDGRDLWDRPHTPPTLIERTPVHTRWFLRRWIPEVGVIFEWWADILHDDPVIPVWGKVVWSSVTDPNWNKGFDLFALKAGEYIALDFAKRHNGGIHAVRDATGAWVQFLNNVPVVLNDGAGLPLSGAMLAFVAPTAEAPIGDPENPNDPVVRGLRNLRAGAGGPIVGLCLEWDSHWLAGQHVPRFAPGYVSAHDAAWAGFLADQEVNAGWFANRPVGIGKTPGQTGGQEDFGATKGTYAVVDGDARFIRVLQYSVQAELFRGFNHYEQNGVPLILAAHPRWVTWNGITHYHPGVSPDRLGKNIDVSPGTGWYGYDDEHRSQNNLAAYAMLTDDPFIADQLHHQLTTDAACYRMRFPNNGSGAARAQGRTSGAWAQILGVTEGPDRQAWMNILLSRMTATIHNASLNVTGPVKVLAWGGPDARKQVYLPDGVTLGPWWSCWEHGLAAVGLYNAFKANPTPDTHEILLRICRTLAQFSFFRENGTWFMIADQLWNNGEPIPVGSTSRSMVVTPGIGGVNNWTFAGLLIAREVLATDSGTPPAVTAQLAEFITAMTGGREADTLSTAEWWAAVNSV